MSVALTINGTSRTKNVQWKTLKVNNVLTNQLDSATFDIVYEAVGNSYKPTIGQVVSITDGGTTIFEGPIVRLDERPLSYGAVIFSIECQDYTRFLDRKLVLETYQDMTVAQIIADIVTNFTTDGFTVANVDCDLPVNYIAFNYEPPSDCIKQLAELVGYDWYVDNDMDVHFFAQDVNPAPFSLDDDSGNWDTTSLVLRNDSSQIRNQIYVRGGEYLGSRFTASILANGTDAIYPLGYRYSEIGVTLTGQALNVGVDNLNDPDDYDVLYNYQEKILRWRSERKPTNGSEIRVNGLPYIPVIVKVSDRLSQADLAVVEGGDGVYEHAIIDKSIVTKEAARERANAEIERYKESIVEGSFRTKTAGLRAGQTIDIAVASRAISNSYIINRVVYRMWTPNQMAYEVSLISTKTYGILEWMQRQVREDKKKITINPDEVQDVIANAGEDLTVVEDVEVHAAAQLDEAMGCADDVLSYLNSGPQYVAGSYSPTSLADRKRPLFLNQDCRLRV